MNANTKCRLATWLIFLGFAIVVLVGGAWELGVIRLLGLIGVALIWVGVAIVERWWME